MEIRAPRLDRGCLAGSLAAILLVTASGLAVPAAEPAGKSWRVADDGATVSVLDGDRRLMQYAYTDVPFKPCVRELFSPAGVQVLRDSPQDHKHHHALMFAVAVEGVDFWSETAGCGRQQHRSLADLKTTTRDGRSQARLTQQIDWIGPGDEKPLLCERRTIAVCRGKDLAASLLTWESQLQPAPGRKSARLTGSHYFGLGIRFVESMDRAGRFFNADRRPGELVRGEERLVRSRWCAYTAAADGQPVTVAVFDDPHNPRHPATIFTMPRQFAYLSATLNLWKEPLTLEAGKPLKLRYGVAVWDGEAGPAEVERAYRQWLAQL